MHDELEGVFELSVIRLMLFILEFSVSQIAGSFNVSHGSAKRVFAALVEKEFVKVINLRDNTFENTGAFSYHPEQKERRPS